MLGINSELELRKDERVHSNRRGVWHPVCRGESLNVRAVCRGESLNEWCSRVSPNFATTLFVLLHVAERLAKLHGRGLCHRDVKPANLLWLPLSKCWTLIDFGCAAELGAPPGVALAVVVQGTRGVVVDSSLW